MQKSFIKIFNLVNNYGEVYNYDFDLEEDNTKSYYMDKDQLYFINQNNDINSYVEIISIGFNILGSIGFDPVVKISSKKVEKNKYDELLENLDYLEIDYENDSIENEFDEIVFAIYDNSLLLASGGKKNNKIVIKFNIQNIINNNNLDISKTLDVSLNASSKEEMLRANIIMQDLRLNGLICDLNNENDYSKFRINLNDEDLKKGIINIMDNATKEVVKISEDEIIDYILGVI